jgi:regulator of sigma E protease
LIGEVAGPVGIVSLTSQMTQLGLVYVLQFIAIISINLAIINAIPFPALDGGRLLFLLIEKIKGSPVNAKIERLANSIGFALLIILMIFITFRDITKLF